MHTVQTLHATVQAGGRIEVLTPDLPEGQAVEVTVRPTAATPAKRSAMEILAACRGGVLFHSADEVDSYIRVERDSWDR